MKLFIVLVLLFHLPGKGFSFVSISIESGMAFQQFNDIRIPGDEGDIFSMTEDLSTPAVPFIRANAQFDITDRHAILLTAAPLRKSATGVFDRDIQFQDTIFNANQAVSVSWKFNSWRISYQYKLVMREKIDFSIGITAKLRDAKIAIASDVVDREKTDLGFVPFIRFVLDWKFHPDAGFFIDADALIGPQGRAEDGIAAFYYMINDNFGIYAGYRILEGGADIDEVYNFSLTHYATGGLKLSF